MDKKEKSPEQELVESIGLMVDNGMASSTKIYSGIVKNSDGKTAQVTMNGQDQSVAVCPSDLGIGSIARVFVPGGNMSNAFILGSVSGGGDTPTPTKKNDGVAGSYQGDGTTSKSLTFEFEPKFIYIYGIRYGYARTWAVMINNATYAIGDANDASTFVVNITWNGKSVSWSSAQGAGQAMNESSETYYYFAI